MADTSFVLDIHNYIPNISYTFSYDTVINVDYAGFEYRYPKLFSHKLSINISDYVFQSAYGAKCNGYSKEDFLSFFDSVRGSQDTFLVRCLLDYKVVRPFNDALYNLSNNKVFADGLLQQINSYDLNEYKFIKNYHHDGVNSYKTIYDLDSTPKIYSQTGVLIPSSQYSIVCTTIGGCRLVKNNTMPVGVIPSYFEGTFLYRVRFANPTLEIEQVSSDLFKVSSLELISEVQPEQFGLYAQDFPKDVNTTTRNLLLKGELSNIPNNSVFPRSTTEGKPMQTFTYGWRNESVEANSTGIKAVSSRSRESLVSVPSKNINTLESRLLLNQLLANKGRLLMFNYKYGTNFGNTPVKARFDADSLTFNMRHLNGVAGQDCEGLYEVNNLSFKTYPTSVTPYTFKPLFNPEAPIIPPSFNPTGNTTITTGLVNNEKPIHVFTIGNWVNLITLDPLGITRVYTLDSAGTNWQLRLTSPIALNNTSSPPPQAIGYNPLTGSVIFFALYGSETQPGKKLIEIESKINGQIIQHPLSNIDHPSLSTLIQLSYNQGRLDVLYSATSNALVPNTLSVTSSGHALNIDTSAPIASGRNRFYPKADNITPVITGVGGLNPSPFNDNITGSSISIPANNHFESPAIAFPITEDQKGNSFYVVTASSSSRHIIFKPGYSLPPVLLTRTIPPSAVQGFTKGNSSGHYIVDTSATTSFFRAYTTPTGASTTLPTNSYVFGQAIGGITATGILIAYKLSVDAPVILRHLSN